MALLMISGCYKPEFEQIQKELDNLRNTEIASLKSQVDSISTSLGSLESLSGEIVEYIDGLTRISSDLQVSIGEINVSLGTAKESLSQELNNSKSNIITQLEASAASLEQELVNIETVIANLQEEDALLDEKIDSLRSYANGNFAEKNWIEGTFSTIEQQNAIISTVASIKQQITTLDASIGQVEKQIIELADNKVTLLNTELEDNLKKAVEDLIDSYTDVIAQTKDEVLAAFSEGLKNSIEESETKVMNWVNSKLDDYYTVIQAEAQVKAFNDMIGDLPDGHTVQSEIDAFKEKLADTKQKIEEAYTEYITKAISESEGRISNDIDQKITAFRTDVIKPLSDKLETLQAKVDDLYEKLRTLDSRVSTMEEQAESIQNTISDMENFHSQLENYIREVESAMKQADEERRAELESLLGQLTSYCSTLQSNINTLKDYIGTIPSDAQQVTLTEWAEFTMNTVTLQFEGYYTIVQIDAKLKDITDRIKAINETLGKHDTKIDQQFSAITDSIGTLKKDMKDWVNQQLSAYMTTAELDVKLDNLSSALKSLFKAGDDEILKKIAAVQESLLNARTNITKEYGDAINEAITAEEGYITKTIRDRFASINADLDTIKTDTDSISEELILLNGRMAVAEATIKDLTDSLTNVSNKFDALIKDYDGQLKDYIKDLNDSLDRFKGQMDESSTTFNNLWQELNKEGGLQSQVNSLLALQDELTAVQSNITKLQTFMEGFTDPDTIKSLVDELNNLIGECATVSDYNSANQATAEFRDLHTRVQTLESSMATVKSQIAALKEYAACFGDTTVADIINTLKAEIALCCHDTSLTNLSTRVGMLEARNDSVLIALGVIEGDIDTLQKNAADLLDSAELFSPTLEDINTQLQEIVNNQKTKYGEKAEEIALLSRQIDTLKHDLDSAFDWIKKLNAATATITGRVTSLDDSLKNILRSKLASFQQLTADNKDKIKLLQDSVANLTIIYNKVSSDYTTALESISSLEKKYTDTLFVAASTLKDLIKGLNTTLDVYATNKNLSDLNDSIVKLMPYIYKVDSLFTAYETSKATIDKLNDFLEGYDSEDRLKDTLDAITSRFRKIAADGKATQDSLKSQIDSLMNILCGEGGTPADPASGSILDKLSSMESDIVNKEFSSITYIPDYQDGIARMDANNGIKFRFLVKPASIAPLLTTTNCKMCWIPTQMTRASYGNAFNSATVQGSADGTITYSVQLTGSEISAFEDGASAALFVTLDANRTFASKYIPVWVNEYFRTSTSTLNFSSGASHQTFTVHPTDNSWSVQAIDSWITVKREDDNKTVTVSVPKYKLTPQRTGYVIVTRGSDKRFVTVNQTGISASSLQTLTFNPTQLEIPYSGSTKDTKIVVTSSDGDTDWIVDRNNTSKWFTINDSQKPTLQISASKSDYKRSGVIQFLSASNNPYSVNVSQRGGHEIISYPTQLLIGSDGETYLTEEQQQTQLWNWSKFSEYSKKNSHNDLTISQLDNNQNWTFEYNESSKWLEYNKKKPEINNKKLRIYKVESIDDWIPNRKQATITITADDNEDNKECSTFDISITQYRPLSVGSNITRNSNNSYFQVTIHSDTPWKIYKSKNADVTGLGESSPGLDNINPKTEGYTFTIYNTNQGNIVPLPQTLAVTDETTTKYLTISYVNTGFTKYWLLTITNKL